VKCMYLNTRFLDFFFFKKTKNIPKAAESDVTVLIFLD
jgi:hypothetical protein